MVTTEWACILDCDTEIIDPNFWSIIDCATDNKLPLVIPASLYRNNDLQDCFDQIDTVLLGYIFSKKFLKPFLKSYNNMKISMLNSCKPFDVSYFWNQCVFINKTVYTQFRYSELLYVWACDFELSKRLHRSGQRLVCLPNFKIKHYGEGSSKHDSLNRILGVLKGEFTYTSIAYPIIAPILHVLAIAARAGRLMVHMLKLENRQKVNFEKLLFKSHVKLLFRQPCDFHLK
jgi:GT2 family glycosyltransferase